jgi:hypothetical protein
MPRPIPENRRPISPPCVARVVDRRADPRVDPRLVERDPDRPDRWEDRWEEREVDRDVDRARGREDLEPLAERARDVRGEADVRDAMLGRLPGKSLKTQQSHAQHARRSWIRRNST